MTLFQAASDTKKAAKHEVGADTLAALVEAASAQYDAASPFDQFVVKMAYRLFTASLQEDLGSLRSGCYVRSPARPSAGIRQTNSASGGLGKTRSDIS